jgi:copper transport protein
MTTAMNHNPQRAGTSPTPQALPAAAEHPRFRQLLRRMYAMVGLATLLLFGIPAQPAFAHAELLSSSPAAGSVLDNAPSSLVLTWSEPVTSNALQVRLVDELGSALDAHVMAMGTTTTMHVPQALTPGSYLISWKVISADGHLVSGLIPFAVAPLNSGVDAQPGDQPTAISAGGTPRIEPTTGDANPIGSGPLDRAAESLSWVSFFVALAAVMVQRRRLLITAVSITVAVVTLRVWEAGLAFGASPLNIGEVRASIAVAAASLVLLATFFVNCTRWRVAIAGSSLGFFTLQSLYSGHHLDLAGNTKLIATVAHAAHLGAVALWVAAVVALLLRRTSAQAAVTRRLSTISVAVLALAGSVLAYLLAFPLRLDETWTRVFLAKIATLVVVSALAIVHHRRTAGTHAEPERWAGTLRAEIALLFVVSALSAALTTSTPAAISEARADRGTGITAPANPTSTAPVDAEATSASVEQELRFNGFAVAQLTYRAGTWELVFTETVDTTTIDVLASERGAGVEGFTVQLTGDGTRFSGTGAFPLPGVWQIELTFLAGQFDLQSVTTQIEIGASQ